MKKISVSDLGRGTLKDAEGNMYYVDGSTVFSNDDGKEYIISGYDDYDNVIEIKEVNN